MNNVVVHPEVKEAIKNGKPVVALESTIISHGMPYPENVQMARKVEHLIRKEGVTPATIAILDGVIKVGLSDEEIELLAKAKDVVKVSKRDFGYVCSQKKMGATTVSATMIAAKMAGISIFATGGIGGVHRGAETTMDISRDLEELASVEVCVVCAGAKSILDLELTLEYLETKGVEVIGYQTDELPAFYTRKSGFPVTYRLDTPEEVAALLHSKWKMGITSGVVLANPIPMESEIAYEVIQNAIEEALLQAKNEGIQGKETTPYLLAKVKEITRGKSLQANLALVYHNATVAAKVARAYSNIF
jgi:pseudouridylate synthase